MFHSRAGAGSQRGGQSDRVPAVARRHWPSQLEVGAQAEGSRTRAVGQAPGEACGLPWLPHSYRHGGTPDSCKRADITVTITLFRFFHFTQRCTAPRTTISFHQFQSLDPLTPFPQVFPRIKISITNQHKRSNRNEGMATLQTAARVLRVRSWTRKLGRKEASRWDLTRTQKKLTVDGGRREIY